MILSVANASMLFSFGIVEKNWQKQKSTFFFSLNKKFFFSETNKNWSKLELLKKNWAKFVLFCLFVVFSKIFRRSKYDCTSLVIIVVLVIANTTSYATTNQWRHQWTTGMSILQTHILMLLFVKKTFSR